jgi:hypothetical protein
MRHAARTHVGKAGKPHRPDKVEVAYDQIDTGMGRDDVAKLSSIASLPMIEVNIRNLDPCVVKDERYPLASRFRLRWA